MSSDVVLTAALRNNLLSLQNTQSLIDRTQIRLATGRKVNSALDNAQSFFAAQSLNNRASDLSRLLDGIGQSVSTLKAADQAITGLQSLVDQADSIATQARDQASGASGGAVIETSGVDYNAINDLGADLTNVTDTDELYFEIRDADGTAITLADVDGAGAGVVSIEDLDTPEVLVSKINQLNQTATLEDAPVIKASITSEGNLRIESLNGESFRITTRTSADAADLSLATALGFNTLDLGERTLTTVSAANDESRGTIVAGAKLVSQSLYSAAGTLATGSTVLDNLTDADGTALNFTGADNDSVVIGVNGGTLIDVGDIEDESINDVVNSINSNTSLNALIEASYDAATGKFEITAIDASVRSIQVGALGDDTNATSAQVDFGFSNFDQAAAIADGAGANVNTESFILSAGGASVAQLEKDFNTVRAQIDAFVGDASFRGVNLLAGDDLQTFFNEDLTSSLTVQGATLTVTGLGISEANFGSTGTIDDALTEIRASRETIRTFSTSLGSSLNIIQTRQSFTQNFINTLTEAADKLTVADQNEEGANLLALQTRQTLGVTSLSLASQSQQAVLRLF